MSITDELREFMAGADGYELWCPRHKNELTAIANRIDAEHEAKVSYWQGASYKDGYDDGFASADDWLGQHEDAMAEHGWVKLPVDADGEYIRIGDVMDSRVDYLFDGKPFTVRALVLCEDGWEVADGRFGNRYEPDSLRHHRKPTVEDVLREFALAVCKDDALTIRKGVVEEFAKRLTLAEGEDA